MPRRLKGMKRRSSGIRAASRTQQENLSKKANRLADDPGLLIPECIGDCRRCDFERILAKFERINRFKNSTKIIQRFARTGSQLERAYAVMLLLATEEKPPFLGVAKLHSGEVSYAMRGKVKKEVLIGVQHYDDAKIRLLAFSEIAIKRQLHLYSGSEGLSCSGKYPKYPSTLISEVLQETDYKFKKDGDDYHCIHVAGEGIAGVLTVDVLSAKSSITLCDNCTSDKENLYTSLAARVLSKHPESDFKISLDFHLECKSDHCTIGNIEVRKKMLLREYIAGGLSDRALMDAYASDVRSKMKMVQKRLLVIGGRCYEEDIEAFVDALRPSNIERKALLHILQTNDVPVVVDSTTANAVLSIFWNHCGVGAINTIVDDKALAKQIFSQTKDSGKTPSQILRDSQARKKAIDIIARLPTFTDLPPIAKFVDAVARTYRIQGKNEAVRELEKAQKDETKMKSVACGFLNAMNSIKGKEWLFTKEELDYGNYLSDFSKSLLEVDPENYIEVLQNLLTASGSGETIT